MPYPDPMGKLVAYHKTNTHTRTRALSITCTIVILLFFIHAFLYARVFGTLLFEENALWKLLLSQIHIRRRPTLFSDVLFCRFLILALSCTHLRWVCSVASYPDRVAQATTNSGSLIRPSSVITHTWSNGCRGFNLFIINQHRNLLRSTRKRQECIWYWLLYGYLSTSASGTREKRREGGRKDRKEKKKGVTRKTGESDCDNEEIRNT